MYAIVRRYTAAKDLTSIVTANRASLEQTMKGLPGFVAYYLVNQGDAVATITICQDQAGAEQSIQRAAEWVTEFARQRPQCPGDHTGRRLNRPEVVVVWRLAGHRTPTPFPDPKILNQGSAPAPEPFDVLGK